MVANIGLRERRRRRVIGHVMLAVGILAFVALLAGRVERWWRLGLFVPFWLGWLGYFQSWEGT